MMREMSTRISEGLTEYRGRTEAARREKRERREGEVRDKGWRIEEDPILPKGGLRES